MRTLPVVMLGCALGLGARVDAQSNGIQSSRPGGNDLRVTFRPAPTTLPNAAVSRSAVLEHSVDLVRWDAVGDFDLGNAYAYQGGLRVPSDMLGEEAGYFRFRVEESVHYTTENAAEFLGFEGPFTSALSQRYYARPEDLARDYPRPDFSNLQPAEVTTAEFWDLFDTDPKVNNAGRDPMKDGWRLKDYRLNDTERALFDKNGFVVSERLATSDFGGSPELDNIPSTFGDMFYDLWTDDLPVFISTDALLQAWHYSFEHSLEEIDEMVMSNELESILSGLLARLKGKRSLYSAGDRFLKQAFEDVDLFLTVAQSLLKGELLNASFAEVSVAESFFDAANKGSAVGFFDLFGSDRVMDFTQFKARGHYVNSVELTRYFQAMMWCQSVDFRLTPPVGKQGDEREIAAARRQLGAAALLAQLSNDEAIRSSWQSMENVIAAVGGHADALVPPQMLDMLEAASLTEVGSVDTLEVATALQARLLEGSLGVQNIRSHGVLSPLSQQQAVLSRSLAFFSQRFVLDSWAMSKVVFDSILFDEDGIPGLEDKVQRRIPSGLDVAFTTFANNAALPTIVDRMNDENGRRFRDGLYYQNNLAAVRSVIDAQPGSAWEGNVYHQWLGTLRALSGIEANGTVPEVFRSEAWAMKDLNTQLASWTHLRHDTVLYAKQSATALSICSYPDGYVEPRPLFWERLRETAESMQTLIAALPGEGELHYSRMDPNFGGEIMMAVNLAEWRDKLSGFYQNFAAQIAHLERLVAKELQQDAFTEDDLTYIDALMQSGGSIGSGGERRYDGWYPQLYYSNLYDSVDDGSAKTGALVTDVHTDFPDAISGDPGTVLHEAVGEAFFMLIAVERENGRRAVYAGPVLSHYEFDTGDKIERLNDAEWRERWQVSPPAPGEWTRAYLASGR